MLGEGGWSSRLQLHLRASDPGRDSADTPYWSLREPITTSLYDPSVRSFLQSVRAVAAFLDRAPMHGASTNVLIAADRASARAPSANKPLTADALEDVARRLQRQRESSKDDFLGGDLKSVFQKLMIG